MILKHFFKNLFVPTLQNELKPYLLRKGFLILVVVIVVLLQLGLIVYTQVIFPRSNILAEVVSSVLVQETNNYRVSKGERELKTNPLLVEAAKLKAQDMVNRGYFSHVGPDGERPWVWFDKVGYNYDYAGENLAIDFIDSIDVSKAWVHSPKHRDNLLNVDFSEVGIGIASGLYNGKYTTFVVQFFGTPARTLMAVASTREAPIVKDIVNTEQEQKEKQQEQITSIAMISTDGAVLGTSTKSIATNTAIEGTTAQYDMSGIYKIVATSPNFSVRQVMLVILVVLFSILFVPIFVIMKSNRISGLNMKVSEMFKLYKSSIVTVTVVIFLTGLFILVNYIEFSHAVKVL